MRSCCSVAVREQRVTYSSSGCTGSTRPPHPPRFESQPGLAGTVTSTSRLASHRVSRHRLRGHAPSPDDPSAKSHRRLEALRDTRNGTGARVAARNNGPARDLFMPKVTVDLTESPDARTELSPLCSAR